jgi:hypothetical protein
MAIFPGDVIIKTAIELGLDDLKKSPWIIEHIFSDFIENPYLKQKYGMKEIQRAKEFFFNNKIHLYMHSRQDKEEFPNITVRVGPSNEDKNLATLGDQSDCVAQFDPESLNKPLDFIVEPFTPVSYDISTGTMTLPNGSAGFEFVNEGMILVDIDNGNGYIVKTKKAKNKVIIAAGNDLTGTKYAIAPRYQFYRARVERIISQETYSVGCHAHGDPSTLLFLYAIVKYSLLRYREGLLEYNNFQLSNLNSSEIMQSNEFGEDKVYSRYITLTGQVEETWLKTPFRVIEAIDAKDEDGGSGIKIMSNEVTIQDSEEAENDLWTTIDSEED